MAAPDCLFFFSFGALTLGGWFIWELVRSGPTLLADVLIDAELLPAHPELATRIPSAAWLHEFFGATGLHYFGLATAAFLVGFVGLFPIF